jgi:hypothetical protein
MRILAALLVAVLALPACLEDEPKKYDKDEFAIELAQRACAWIYACCDTAEKETLLGAGATEASCVSTMTTTYSSLVADARDEDWNGTEAASCIDGIDETTATCPKSFDIAEELDDCKLVEATKQPGDMCESSWECTTKFCKSGVCANPLPKGSSCAAGERCAAGLKCINGECSGLQPDGSACTTGDECISGTCGGGKCVVSATYTCDGE